MTKTVETQSGHFEAWRARLTWPGLCALIALTAVALEYPKIAPLFKAGRVYFDDPDDYTRLVRARAVIEHGPHLIRTMSDINPPAGLESHWTAPMDYLLVAFAKTAGYFIRNGDALAISAAFVPPILGFAYICIMMGLITRVAGQPAAVLGGVLIALTPAWHRAFAFGHPDHHCLLELLFAIALSALAPRPQRAFPSPFAIAVSGVATGLAAWVAAQGMLIWLALLVGLIGVSVISDRESAVIWSRARRTWAVSAAAVIAIGHLVENAPRFNAATLDKISLPFVMIATLAAVIPRFTSSPAPATRRGGPAKLNTRSLAPFAIACLGCAIWFFAVRHALFSNLSSPEFFRWHATVAELQPLFTHAGGQWSLGKLHALIGYLPYALPLLLVPFTRDKSLPAPFRITCGLFAPMLAALTILQVRWLDHFNLFVVPVVAIGLIRLGEVSIHPRHNSLFAAALVLALIALPAAKTIVTRTPSGQQAARVMLDRTAHVANVIRDYDRREPSPMTGTILSEEGDGPMLLYETRRPIIAAPYHRALTGIVESAAFFSERDPIEARRRLDRLNVRYIVVPVRVHEQLYNFETLVFGNTPSFDPPDETLDAEGRIKRTPHYRPGVADTMAYRLSMTPGDIIPGVRLLARAPEPTAPTPDHMIGLLYVVDPP